MSFSIYVFFSTEEYHYNVNSATEEKLKRIKSSNQYKGRKFGRGKINELKHTV